MQGSLGMSSFALAQTQNPYLLGFIAFFSFFVARKAGEVTIHRCIPHQGGQDEYDLRRHYDYANDVKRKQNIVWLKLGFLIQCAF